MLGSSPTAYFRLAESVLAWPSICLAVGATRALLAVILCLPFATAAGEATRDDATLELVDPGGRMITRLQVEIADTPDARRRGLMDRSLTDDENGMLFVFPNSAPRAFWMRNTPGSLDILFADARRRIIHIAPETKPMSDRIYSSPSSAMYVLETRAGFAARHGIEPGASFDYYPRPVRDHGSTSVTLPTQ